MVFWVLVARQMEILKWAAKFWGHAHRRRQGKGWECFRVFNPVQILLKGGFGGLECMWRGSWRS